jgi:hypothetical protein
VKRAEALARFDGDLRRPGLREGLFRVNEAEAVELRVDVLDPLEACFDGLDR